MRIAPARCEPGPQQKKLQGKNDRAEAVAGGNKSQVQGQAAEKMQKFHSDRSEIAVVAQVPSKGNFYMSNAERKHRKVMQLFAC